MLQSLLSALKTGVHLIYLKLFDSVSGDLVVDKVLTRGDFNPGRSHIELIETYSFQTTITSFSIQFTIDAARSQGKAGISKVNAGIHGILRSELLYFSGV